MGGLHVKGIATIGLAINYIFILLFVFAMPPILWAAVAGALVGLSVAYVRMFVEGRRP
jgi:hypothetical protein